MGSPARAGIDHIINAGNTKCFGFPRTRGDRPERAKVEAFEAWVPPHARG